MGDGSIHYLNGPSPLGGEGRRRKWNEERVGGGREKGFMPDVFLGMERECVSFMFNGDVIQREDERVAEVQKGGRRVGFTYSPQ